MINETRAAEAGGEIISDTSAHTFSRSVIGLRALETTVVNTVTCSDPEVTGIGYYNGKTLAKGEAIDANIKTIQLNSGAVQAYYAK